MKRTISIFKITQSALLLVAIMALWASSALVGVSAAPVLIQPGAMVSYVFFPPLMPPSSMP